MYLLYRATLDHSHLEDFLDHAAAELDCHNVGLLIQDFEHVENSRFITNRDGSEATELYSEVAEDNFFLDATAPHIAPGKVLWANKVMDDRELQRSRFYADYLKPTDIYNSLGITLRADEELLVGMAFNRAKSSVFTAEEERWATNLVPHLQSYIGITRRLVGERLSSDSAWGVLDMQHYGIQVFDENHRPQYANHALQSIVDNSVNLQWRGGTLHSQSSDLNSWMSVCEKAIDSKGVTAEPMAMTGSWGDERYQFVFAPLFVADGFRERIFRVLYVSDLRDNSRSFGDNLGRLYKLTPREVEVALLIVQGLSTREIAAQLNVAESTVITHKKSLFVKTDVHKQSELVRVALSLDIANTAAGS